MSLTRPRDGFLIMYMPRRVEPTVDEFPTSITTTVGFDPPPFAPIYVKKPLANSLLQTSTLGKSVYERVVDRGTGGNLRLLTRYYD